MSQALINRIRKGRQSRLEVNGKTIIVRRPTDFEMLALSEEQQGIAFQSELVNRFVCGWDGFTELDLTPGGTGAAVEFSPELWAEWVADHPEFWAPVANEVVRAYREHEQALVDARGN